MAKLYSTVAVESNDSEAIVGFLQSTFGIVFRDLSSDLSSSEFNLGLHFHVSKPPKEWLYGVDSLGNPLPEKEPFYCEFDVSTFKTHVDLFCGRDSDMANCLHVIADAVGKAISKGVNRRVLVFLDGTNVPFCLYDHGEKTKRFTFYSEEYMKSRYWLPSGE